MTQTTGERWAVVGGGILGMTLAHRLRQRGKEVTLIEAAPRLGGLASAWSLGDVIWDRHYHVTLLSDAALRGLLRELGLDREIVWGETRTGVFVDGRLYSVSNLLEFLRFPPLRWFDKLRLGGTIFYASKIRNWKRLERISVSDWLRRWSGQYTFEHFWLPLLRSKLGENYRFASAAFIWATVARLYAARRTGLKKEMFGYVRGGYARVLERFGAMLSDEGVRLMLGEPVTRVEREKSEITVVFRDGARLRFDRVVVTSAAPVTAKLCPTLQDREKALLENVRYQGIVCASCLLKRPLSDFYVTNLLDPDLPFTGVIEMTTLVEKEEIGGHTLVYLPRYVTQDDPFFDRTDAEIEETFLSALERMYPGLTRRQVVAFKLSRVRYVCPVPTKSYSAALPPMVTSVPGLFLVNSAHIVAGTLNVNETIQLAEQAAERICRRDDRPSIGT